MHDFVQLCFSPTTIVPYHFGSVQTLYTPNFIPVTLSFSILHLR